MKNQSIRLLRLRSGQVRSGQLGFAPILIVIVVAVIALGAAGYLLTNKGKSTGGGFTLPKIGGPALNASCELNDPDLCKYVNRAMTGDFYKNGLLMSSTTTDKTGKKQESSYEMDGKENSKITSYQDGKETMSIINLNKTTYMKDYSDGKWWKYENKQDQKSRPEGDRPLDENFKDQAKKIAEEMKDKTSYKKIGKETCGSLSCFKYQVIIKDLPDLIEYIYFDDREYLTRKMRTEDKNGSVTEMSYEYRSVSITEPAPIKEGSPWGNATNQSGTGANGVDSEQMKKIQEEIKKQMENSNQESSPE